MKGLGLAGLLLTAAMTGHAQAQEACLDSLRQTKVMLDYYATSKARDMADAVKAIAELQKRLEALTEENAALKKSLPTGQNK